MTTRKHLRHFALAAAVGCAAFGGAGCATPGPLHVYTIAPADPAVVHDATRDAPAVAVPDFLGVGETLTGFAYDPFTDHFFLRLAPGDRIRVVDRPARAIKREFRVAELRATGGGDLAVRPGDGHIFALVPGDAALVEFTRYGEFVGRIAPEKIAGPPRGVAFDAARNRLLILGGGSPAHITAHAPDGRPLASVTLDRAIAGVWLAYDPEQRAFYAPLAGGNSVGIFAEDGHLQRTLPITAEFLDVGPRSLLRIF